MITTRTLLTVLTVFPISLTAFAQYQPVVFDPSSNLLGNGQPLPAEKQWSITGPVSADIGIVEARVYEDAAMKHMATKGRWERTDEENSPSFNINLDQKLRGNDKYTVELGFYSPIGREASDTLASRLGGYIDAYMDQTVEISSNRIRLTKPVSQVMDELNIVVRRGTDMYRSRLNLPFSGFSQLVEDKLAQLNDTRLSDGKYMFKKKEDEDKRNQRIDMAKHEIAGVKAMLTAELSSYLDRDMLVLRHRTLLTDQATEHTPTTIALNIGYGGIYNSGSTDDLSYGQAPYLGVSFPLGRRAFSSRFWSNSSISLGAFLENTKDDDGTTLTGPLIDRPIYLGYGYRVFRMIRLNAGGTLVEKNTLQLDGGTSSSLQVRPFLGVSIEINLWLGIGK